MAETDTTTKQMLARIKHIVATNNTNTEAIVKLLDIPSHNIEHFHSYRYLSGNNQTVLAIQLEDGHWQDVTELVQAQEDLKQAEQELLRAVTQD